MPRPMAPDPMRATMYGHDVHQFEFPAGTGDATPTPQQPPPQQQPPRQPTPPGASTALVVADPAVRSRELFLQQAEAAGAVGRSTQMPFQLAHHGEAQRLVRPGGQKPTPYPPPSSVARVPLTSKLVFAAGIAAFTGAVLIWLLSGNEPETASAPTAPPAAVVQTRPAPAPARARTPTPSATPTPAPARAPTPAAPAVQPPPLPPRTASAPARAVVSPSLRAPEPIPLVTEPKTEPACQGDGGKKRSRSRSRPPTRRTPRPRSPRRHRRTRSRRPTDANRTKEREGGQRFERNEGGQGAQSALERPDAPLPPSSLD